MKNKLLLSLLILGFCQNTKTEEVKVTVKAFLITEYDHFSGRDIEYYGLKSLIFMLKANHIDKSLENQKADLFTQELAKEYQKAFGIESLEDARIALEETLIQFYFSCKVLFLVNNIVYYSEEFIPKSNDMQKYDMTEKAFLVTTNLQEQNYFLVFGAKDKQEAYRVVLRELDHMKILIEHFMNSL